MKTKNISTWAKVSLTLMIALASMTDTHAQLNLLGSGYFRNQYLFNPAMAGLQQKLQVSAGTRRQFTRLPGAPVTQALTAEYAITDKAAVGLLLNDDKAGILKHSRLAGSFAYHLPLGVESQHLNFGISLTFNNDNVDYGPLQGDINDPDIADVNLRDNYLDGDFGAAYTSNSLQVQFALPNMKRLFKKDIYAAADRSMFFSSVSYRLRTGVGMLEPKVVFRGVQGYDHLIDGGANFEFNSNTPNKLSTFALYHSARSATFGFGITWNNTFGINGMYTTNTSPLQGYTNGDFEIAFSYGIVRRRQ